MAPIPSRQRRKPRSESSRRSYVSTRDSHRSSRRVRASRRRHEELTSSAGRISSASRCREGGGESGRCVRGHPRRGQRDCGARRRRRAPQSRCPLRGCPRTHLPDSPPPSRQRDAEEILPALLVSSSCRRREARTRLLLRCESRVLTYERLELSERGFRLCREGIGATCVANPDHSARRAQAAWLGAQPVCRPTPHSTCRVNHVATEQKDRILRRAKIPQWLCRR